MLETEAISHFKHRKRSDCEAIEFERPELLGRDSIGCEH